MTLITFNDGTEIQEPYVTYDAETKVFRNSQGEEIPAPEAFVMMREFRVREGKKEAVERLEEKLHRAGRLVNVETLKEVATSLLEQRKKEMLEPLSTPTNDD